MYARKLTITYTTDAQSAATVYSDGFIGSILAIIYKPSAAAPSSDGVTLAVTIDETAQPILAATVSDGDAAITYYPRVLTSKNTDGAVTTFYEPVVSAGDRIKVVVGSGGSTTSGSIIVIIG